jgi:putative membrane protein
MFKVSSCLLLSAADILWAINIAIDTEQEGCMKKYSAVLMGMFLAGAASALPPAEFVKKAGASDLYEITSSKLVNMLVTDHTKSTADVKAAAMKSGLKPMPPKLDAKQASDVAALKKASGAARDSLYINQQKAAHQEALALHKDNAANSTAPALKAVSATVVPVVEHHISQLSSM